MGHNVATFLWRTLYVQAVRRHPFWTAFELLYVALFFHFSLRGTEPVAPLSQESRQQDADSRLLPKMPSKVLFGPGGIGNERLMRTAMTYIEKRQQTGSKVPPKSAHVKYLFVNQSDKVASVCAKLIQRGYISHTDDYAVSDHLAVEENDTAVSRSTSFYYLPLCVALGGQADDDFNLTFTVYAPVHAFPTESLVDEIPAREGGFMTAARYQYVIEQAHKQLRREAANFSGNLTKITVEHLPGWVFESVKQKYLLTFFPTLYTGFFVPLLIRISSMGYEFTSGLADQQGVMGLSTGQLIAGHFLTAMAYAVTEGVSAVTAMYVTKMADNVTSYAHDIDPSLLGFSFVMFHIGHTLLAVMIAWVFPQGWAGLMFGVLVMMIAPLFIEWGESGPPVPKYILTSRRSKLLAGVLPHMGAAYVIRILFLARDYEGKAGWSLVFKRVLERDNITIFELWTVMLASDVAMIFLTWYLSKVLPWSTKNPQEPCFCCRVTYWQASRVENAAIVDVVERDPDRFEQLPPSRRAVIVTQNLVKVFGTKTALNSVDLRVYEPNVTVLLGHNGAGKTTLMNILTGKLAPTSGTVHVCGLDVAAQADEVRKKVSFCQQDDVFFPDLTVIENMLYFGSLKGAPSKQLHESIKSALCVVKMEDKAYSMPGQLSGGMKRRLSIAITIASKPDILILDEPTTGLDPETRRTIWDVMQNVSKERTVLLSTHDMDEADAIGDQIIILSSGAVVSSGSTAFLKKACGVGYKLTMVKVPNVFDLGEVHALVKETAPMAEVDEDKQEEAVIALHTLDHKQLPPMFEALENSADRLGIANMGITVASMKDVYLKINMDWAPGGKQREQSVDESDITIVCRPVVKTQSLWRCFYALWIKRLLYVARSSGLMLSVIVLPLLLLLFVTAIAPVPYGRPKQLVPVGTTRPIELSLATHFPNSTVIVEQAPGQITFSAALRALLESQGCRVRSVANITAELRQEHKLDFGHYMSTYPMAVAFESDVVRVISNPTMPITLPLAINLVDSAELRSSTAQPLARIDATIAYLMLPEAINLFEALFMHVVAIMYWPALPAISYALVFAGLAAFPVAERLGGARDVQLMTGISGAFFIGTHALFDLLHYVIVMGLWCLLHFSFSGYGLRTARYIALTFACFAPSAIGMSYLFAEWALSTGKAMGYMMVVVYAGGMMSMTVFYAIVSALDVETHCYAFYLFPPFALIRALAKITSADLITGSCQEFMAELAKTNKGARVIVPANDVCRSIDLLSFNMIRGIAAELIYMVGIGMTMLVAMSFLVSGYLVKERSFTPTESKLDDDVDEHRTLVNELKKEGDFSEQALVAWRLHKRFGALHAVKGLYLALRPSECFGLLGVNGAGKTTTFQMLAKLISASYGDAYTAKARLSGNTRKWQSQINYCFQLGGLLDRLNSYEYLYLVGRLRGISDADLEAMVDSVLSVVDLKEYAGKPCGVYSGGNRRKLSIGSALLGLAPLVYLDEPYAGVDVVARNKIFRAIATLRKNSSAAFVLTSHNMEECEFSCDRLTIMAAGEMRCLGTLQHLREKFGAGYRLEVVLSPDNAAAAEEVTQAVQREFPGAIITEKRENMQGFNLTERMPWSELFRRLCRLEEECTLQHSMVGENTLEQIFLQFAKPEGKPAKPEGKPAEPEGKPVEPEGKPEDTTGNDDPEESVPVVASRPEAVVAREPADPAIAS